MIQCVFNKKMLCNPCRIRHGLLFFFLVHSFACAAGPSVGCSIVDNGGYYRLSLRGYLIESFQTCVIKIEYPSGIDIYNAMLNSPVNSLSVGASVDSTTNVLSVIISQTKKISIDNIIFVDILFPVSGTGVQMDLVVQSITFTDYNGGTYNAEIFKDVHVRYALSAVKRSSEVFSNYYLLSGRKVLDDTQRRRQFRICGGLSSVRIFEKIDRYK